MGEVKITYNTLFELLRRERTRHEVQKLDSTFYTDVAAYLADKSTLKKAGNTMFLQEETARQLENARRILKHLYDKREKKIVQLAMDVAVRFNAGDKLIVDTTVLLESEKALYKELVKLFEKYRSSILFKVLQAKQPEAPKAEPEIRDTKNQNNSQKIVRILTPVQQFVGEELEVYGPFQKEDIAALPAKIANILIAKENAECIEE